jgi:hypothetical protein
LLLLGDTDWPQETNRLARILNQYPINLELKNWLQQEYRLRFWTQYYSLDLSDNLDCELYRQLPTADLPRVWLNHSAFWQEEQLAWFADHCNIVFVAPTTATGLEWQIRSYASKKTVPLLHDFCFEHSREQQRRQYIETHGEQAYHTLNIVNMKHIIDQRQQLFVNHWRNRLIALELLLTGSAEQIHTAIKQLTNLYIPTDAIDQVVTAWRGLHWDNTTDWEYSNIFQQ